MGCGYQNLGRILYMSITISIHYSLTATVNTIYPELADQKDYPYIGQMTIMITYIMEIVSNIYSQKYVSLTKSGLSFFFSGLLPILTYVPAFIINRCEDKTGICSYYSISLISLIGFGLQGLGLGAYFLLQNCYQSACTTNIYGRDLLQGLSFTIIGMAFLIGNSYSLPLIGYLGREEFFVVLGIAQFIVTFFFLLLPNPEEQEISLERDDNLAVNKVSEASIESEPQTSTTVLVDQIEDLVDEQDPLQAMILYLRQPSVQKLVPYFFLTGLVVGFEFGQLYQVIVGCLPKDLDQVTVNQKTFQVFIFFGIGEILSGPIIALLKGRVDLSSYLKLYTYLTGITIIITGLNVYLFKSYEFCFLVALCWGTIDNFGQSTSNIVITKQWGDNLSLFGIYLVFQNIGAVVYPIFAIFFSYSKMIYGLSFLLLIQMVSVVNIHIFINKFYKKTPGKNKQQHKQN